MNLFLLFLATIAFSVISSVGISAAETTKYYYVSDTERYYYEKEPYEYTYTAWQPYTYWVNSTHYEWYYYPYAAVGHSFRKTRVYQYYLTVKTDAPGANVDGTGWYNEGNNAPIYASSTVESDSDVKYIFAHWAGDYSGGSQSASVNMDDAKTVTAVYKVKYHLLVKSTPTDAMGFIEDGWYEEGTSKIIQEAPEYINYEEGARYIFDAWYIDGKKMPDSRSISITMDGPHETEAKFNTQYYLDVRSAHGDPQGVGWYGEGTAVTFSVDSPVGAGIGKKWVFERWSGDLVSTSPQENVLMGNNKSVIATWKLDSTVLYIIYGIIISAIVAAVLIYHTQFRYAQSCSKCGNRLSSNFKLCPQCGKSTRTRSSERSK